MPKSSKLETERQLVKVQEWIIAGKRAFEMIDEIVNKEKWCTSDRHAERLIKKARERWAEIQGLTLLEKRHQQVQNLEALKRKMAKKYGTSPSGITTILRIEKEISKLQGLYAPIQHEIGGIKDGEPIKTEEKHTIDYSKLPTEVLKAIVSARTPTS